MIIKVLNKLVKINQASQYHQRHKNTALKTLKKIELFHGKTDPKILKKCDEYAADVFNSKDYSPWLYVYSAMAGEFREGWIPDNFYGKVIVPKIKGGYGWVSNFKPLSKRLLNTDLLPDLIYHANGVWVSKENEILPEKMIQDYLFQNNSKVIYKLDSSEQGKGIFVFDQSNFDWQKVKILGNGVFQEFINQHPFFEEFVSGSVATLRITTVINKNGEASIRASYLRFGRKTDTHVRSSSTIRIAIDIETGEFSEFGYTADWDKTDCHPDTKIKFKGRIIPSFELIKANALLLQKAMPFAKCIGWDLILDKDNTVKLMEWNGWHNGIKFHESSQGPCFADLGWEKLR